MDILPVRLAKLFTSICFMEDAINYVLRWDIYKSRRFPNF